MRLLHYSKKLLTDVRSVHQGDGVAARGDKPNGLWVSVEGDDDWPTWCRSKSFALEDLSAVTEVTLRDSARLLHVATPEQLVSFHQTFSRRHPMAEEGWQHYRCRRVIDWSAVAAEHDAIVIAPYQWEHRYNLEMNWYYGWDCASGCIWNANAVERLTPLHATPSTETADTLLP